MACLRDKDCRGLKVSGKPKCGAKRTGRDGTCDLPAGYGTDHLGFGKCKWHFGNTRALKIAAAKEEMRERFYGDEVSIEPTEAILEEIRRSAGHVRWLHSMILRMDAQLEGQDPDRVLLQLSVTGWGKAAWTKMYADERAHLVKTAKMAIDAGVAERQVRLAESHGELLATILRAVLTDLKLTPEQQALAPEIVTRHLRSAS